MSNELNINLKIDDHESTNTHGVFSIQPLNRGMGTTLGNTLRRVLLTSIPGAAITNVKIDGPVIIGNNCKILGNTSIGPNVSVGDNSIISASHIENSIIMNNCKIDTVTKIKDSIIASNSEIKDNSVNEDKIFLLGEGSKLSL